MYFPRGSLTSFIISLIVTAELANGFAKFDSNRLLLELHANKIVSRQTVERWIEQPLDHFNSNEKRTLKMRYRETLDLWQPHGPIIIYIGGEPRYPEVPDSVSIDFDKMLHTQLAKETHGALVFTEHRYYGHSKPDISRDNMTEYYKFLSSQQALADIAYLIKFLKSDPKYKTSKVVAIGGSYPGNLAVWMRELYPELVDAALAASAPVLAKKDFNEYLDVVRYTFGKYGGEKCLKDMERVYRRYEELLKTSDGIHTLKGELYICPSSDLTVFENQQMLFSNIYDDAAEVAQFMKPIDVKKECQRMDSNHRFMGDVRAGSCCRDVAFNLQNFTDPWTYQFCSEFGYLQTTTSEIQPFVHWRPLEFLLKFCKDLIKGDIEKKIDEGVARTNQMYGGKRPNVTKVVFTNGDMDPWHVLGVLEDLGPDAPAFVINGTSHCAVLVVSDDEPQELTENREYIKKLIKKWISTP